MWNKYKINKKYPYKGHLQDIPDSEIPSSSCEENNFIGCDADSDAELKIFVANKHNGDVNLCSLYNKQMV